MIKIIKDIDLSGHESEYDAIIVGTNIYGSMANGYQLSVKDNFNYVFVDNNHTKYGDSRKLGAIYESVSEGNPTFILAFIVRGTIDPINNIGYEYLENVLKLINVLYKGKNVATTMIGCTEFDGNGDREKVLEIINKTVTNFDLTLYDYKQKSGVEVSREEYRRRIELKEKDPEAYHELVKKYKEKNPISKQKSKVLC